MSPVHTGDIGLHRQRTSSLRRRQRDLADGDAMEEERHDLRARCNRLDAEILTVAVQIVADGADAIEIGQAAGRDWLARLKSTAAQISAAIGGRAISANG